MSKIKHTFVENQDDLFLFGYIEENDYSGNFVESIAISQRIYTIDLSQLDDTSYSILKQNYDLFHSGKTPLLRVESPEYTILIFHGNSLGIIQDDIYDGILNIYTSPLEYKPIKLNCCHVGKYIDKYPEFSFIGQSIYTNFTGINRESLALYDTLDYDSTPLDI